MALYREIAVRNCCSPRLGGTAWFLSTQSAFWSPHGNLLADELQNPTPAIGRYKLNSYRVLCIDDDALLLTTLQELLRANGHEVQIATRGQSGLQALQENSFDVVVTDFEVPDMNGLDVARIASESVPVVIWSGNANQVRKLDAANAASAILDKPASLPILLSTIESIVMRSKIS